MLLLVVCILAGALFVGTYILVSDRDFIGCLIGIFVGGFCGLIIGLIISLVVSLAYYSDSNHYLSETETYKIEEYHTKDNDKKYYVYINNSNGQLKSNIQYLDDEGTPQILHLNYKVEYIYDKDNDPSIAITTYKVKETEWAFDWFATVPSNEYTVIIPGESAVYHKLN